MESSINRTKPSSCPAHESSLSFFFFFFFLIMVTQPNSSHPTIDPGPANPADARTCSSIDPVERLYRELASIPTVKSGRIHRSSKASSTATSLSTEPSSALHHDQQHSPSSSVDQAQLTHIQLDYSISDHSTLNKLAATQSFHLIQQHATHYTSSDLDIHHQQQPIIIPGQLDFVPQDIGHQSLSPSLTKRALFRTLNIPPSPSTPHPIHPSPTRSQSSPQKLLIQVWDTTTHRLVASYDLTHLHSSFVLNDTFGLPTWDPSETRLAYVAETTRTFDRSTWLGRNRYRPDFGEQLTPVKSPAIFILTVPSDHPNHNSLQPQLIQLTDPSTDPSTLVFGQPVFGPAGDQDDQPGTLRIFCTGFASLPDHRRLGLIYCQNRPCRIYQAKVTLPPPNHHQGSTGEQAQLDGIHHPKYLIFTPISPSNRSARSPRVIDGKVIYLSNPIGGPHASCAELHVYTPETQNDKILVACIGEPTDDRGDGFPGLYIDQLPHQSGLLNPSDRQKSLIVTSSIWASSKRLITIDLETGHLKCHPPPSDGSCTVIDSDGSHQVLSIISRTDRSPQVWIGKLNHSTEFSWHLVTHLKPSEQVQALLSKLKSSIIRIPTNTFGPTEIVLTSSTIPPIHQVGAKPQNSLIIVPHGGPHSTSVNEFSPSTAAMALLGHSVAYINYPGSLGFGQKWVEELPRQLGKADVESCKLAVDYLIDSQLLRNLDDHDSARSTKRLFVSGGSHGGFITAHLTSRYPNLFRAACMRNPVVDLVGTASGGSDIPDWSYSEANLTFPFGNSSEDEVIESFKLSVNPHDYKVLRDSSPIKLIHQVKTPTLLLLGDSDRRVSHQQGLAWYHGLKGLKTESEVVMFKDNSHPLNSIDAELNSFMLWFEFISHHL